MKTFKTICLIFLIANLALYTLAQQGPSDPIWGLFASGVGEPLKSGMDPCWITYTVGLMADPKIQINVSNGLMGTLMANVNWYDATAGQRRFGRYFDDQPDGIYKLTPCEVSLPDVSGNWFASTNGEMELTQNGNRITGSANGVNYGDHWGPMGRKGGTVTGTIAGDGTILLQYNWNDGTYSEDVLRLSPDGKSLSGTWSWYTDSSKTTRKGTGTYMLLRN